MIKKSKNRNNKIYPRRKKSGLYYKNIKNLIIVSCFVCVIFVITAMIWKYLTSSEIFVIKKVNIVGKLFLSKEYSKNVLDICKGKNLFNVNVKNVKEYIEKDSGIEGIIVERDFPNALIIKITERKPIAKYKGFLVDYKGFVFKGNNDNLPLIIGDDKSAMRDIARLLGKVKETDEAFYSTIQEVDFTNSRKVKFSNSGLDIYWGDLNELNGDDIIIKIAYLREVLKDVQKQNLSIDYIDMRFLKGDDPSIIVSPSNI